MRKSPYKHQVKTHRRKGKLVHSYERGKGNKPTQRANPIQHKQQSSSQYTVKIQYTRGTERFPVNAPDIPSAIETAMSSRLNIAPPVLVEVNKI